MPIRTVIIDDEPLARSRIVHLANELTDMTIVGECWNARQALEVINRRHPDLIFLDIEMPDRDGFNVLSDMKTENRPMVIVVSAYDQYALKAFQYEVVDYLHKPFEEKRFYQAIERVRNRLDLRRASQFQSQIKELINEQHQPDEFYASSLSIKEDGRLKYFSVYDIYYIEAFGNYVKLHLENGVKMYRSTMYQVQNRLDPDMFTRVHRSYILNTRKIKNIQYLNNNEYKFTMQNGEVVISSRSYKNKIMDVLSMY
ncbi:MAG: response regulator transcription factor [Bacteroidia bacterium]|nr:response regulator transcription factor [Bacteroidia bacterium]